jgi:hypothetical protein
MPISRKPGVSLKSIRWAAFAVAALLAVSLLLWMRAFYGSMEDYKTGEALLKDNQVIRAITYFDRSLHWYAPINPYLEKAATRLWEIGERAEKEGDLRMARIAFESIRNASYGTTHVFTPGKEWIKRVESKIDELSGAKGQKGDGTTEPWSPKKSPHPHALWSVAVVLGFLGWVGSVLGFILAASSKDRSDLKPFRKKAIWLSMSLAFGALWFAGMVMA